MTTIGILDKLDTPKTGDGTPPGLDRDALSHCRPTAALAVRRETGVLGL